NLNAADTVNADRVWPGGGLGLNLSGAGVTVGVWDGGAVLAEHQELDGRVAIMDSVATSGHATHVAGTIGGTGLSADARGMANGVEIRSRDYSNDRNEFPLDAGVIDLSNHSYGNLRGW